MDIFSATLLNRERPMAKPPKGDSAMNPNEEITDTESVEYTIHKNGVRKFPGWIKLTAITAASVLAGGLAAAWIYSKSIERLQNPEDHSGYSNFHISDGQIDDEN